MRFCIFYRLPQTQLITGKTPFPALRDIFHPLCHSIKLICIVDALNKLYRIMYRKLPNKSLLFFCPHMILFRRIYIRVIIKYRHIKVFRKTCNAIGTAWCATTVQQKFRNLVLSTGLCNQIFHYFLVIYRIHDFSDSPKNISSKIRLPVSVRKMFLYALSMPLRFISSSYKFTRKSASIST